MVKILCLFKYPKKDNNLLTQIKFLKVILIIINNKFYTFINTDQ